MKKILAAILALMAVGLTAQAKSLASTLVSAHQHLSEHKRDLAREEIKKGLLSLGKKEDPMRAELYMELAEIDVKSGDYEKAADHYGQIQNLDAPNKLKILAHLKKSQILFRKENVAECITELNAAQELATKEKGTMQFGQDIDLKLAIAHMKAGHSIRALYFAMKAKAERRAPVDIHAIGKDQKARK